MQMFVLSERNYLDSTKFWTMLTTVASSATTRGSPSSAALSVFREFSRFFPATPFARLLACLGLAFPVGLSVNTRVSLIPCSFSHRTPFRCGRALPISKRTRTAPSASSESSRLISCVPLINPPSTSSASASRFVLLPSFKRSLLPRSLSLEELNDEDLRVALLTGELQNASADPGIV